ncbi:hypothetical protein chiPu_0003288 [Chiloscyllium punctatum]|uniref:Uncharacterized protein n=1 Tax=Chiloscyllium punctatum TaxID=137246 RepID=A0A401S390_CHIPU|nr:hypothetical protein [Chiloscyllium punctatum]
MEDGYRCRPAVNQAERRQSPAIARRSAVHLNLMTFGTMFNCLPQEEQMAAANNIEDSGLVRPGESGVV